MKGNIILRKGSYTEMVMREQGSTRLISCFDFTEEEIFTFRNYRLEYWEQGELKRLTTTDRAHALGLFYARIGGEPEPAYTKKRAIMHTLTQRIDAGLCIHCGGDHSLVGALCLECRDLPQFQEVIGPPPTFIGEVASS